jgi:hypothetical protein
MFDMEAMTTAELLAFVGRLYTSDMERSLQQAAREILAKRASQVRSPCAGFNSKSNGETNTKEGKA